MGHLSYSTKNLVSFQVQLRKAIADYVQVRTKEKIKYLALVEQITQKSGLIQQASSDSALFSTHFGVKEYQYLSRLIIVTEREILSPDIRDKVTLIYREMPKYFSFFFPIVDLSDKIAELLTKYPREQLLEIELEEQRKQVQFCNNQIKNLTQSYQESVKHGESLLQKIKEISSVEKLEKVELVRQLNSVKFQCGEYQKILRQQQKNLLALEQQNQKLVTENQTLTQQVEKLLEINQYLQKSLKELQSSYNELHLNYESCPIKNQQDLEQFKQEVLQEITQRISLAKTSEENSTNTSGKIGLFSVLSKQ